MLHFSENMIAQVASALSPDDFAVFQQILVSRGKSKGCLKAQITNPYGRATADAQRVYHVWRMVCFTVQAGHPHSCMPMGLYWYHSEDRAEGKAELKRLDAVADAICKAIGPQHWAGVARWAKALGM